MMLNQTIAAHRQITLRFSYALLQIRMTTLEV